MLDRHVRVANDVLFNPKATVERLDRAFEERVEVEGQEGLDGSSGVAVVERIGESIRERVARFEAREETLRERLAAE